VRAALEWLERTTQERRVFVVATTNYPHLFDESVTRRFRKFLFFDLPGVTTRAAVINDYLSGVEHALTDEDRSLLAWSSTWSTGHDLRIWRASGVACCAVHCVVAAVMEAGKLSRSRLDPRIVHAASHSLDARRLLVERRKLAARSPAPRVSLKDCVRALRSAGVSDVAEFEESLRVWRERRMLPMAI